MPFLENISFKNKILCLALLVYGLTAYFSVGYYHADEHYQIIEFAGSKLGTHSTNELAWEYKAGLRQAIQPTMAYGIIKTFTVFHIDNPYVQTFLIRLLTGLFAIFVINKLINAFYPSVNRKNHTVFIILSFFLWFLPMLNIRFTSETMSGLTLLLALAYAEDNHICVKRKYLLIGILLGFSFIFRFQSAFASLGLIAWLMFIRKEHISKIGSLLLGGFMVLCLGVLLDSWFYNKFTFTIYNYFYTSFLDNNTDAFGTSPWYYYFTSIIHYSIIPIGILILFSLIILAIRKPKHILIWMLFPFILFHTLIPHKEERFLFPMINLIPIVLILAYQEFIEIAFVRRLKNVKSIRIGFVIFIVFCAGLNIIGLFVMTFKPAGIGRTAITKYIHDTYGEKPIKVICNNWANPYNPFMSIPTKYYVQKNITDTVISSISSLQPQQIDKAKVNIFITHKSELKDPDNRKILSDLGFVEVKQSIPKWTEKLNTVYKGFSNDEILVAFEYQSK